MQNNKTQAYISGSCEAWAEWNVGLFIWLEERCFTYSLNILP